MVFVSPLSLYEVDCNICNIYNSTFIAIYLVQDNQKQRASYLEDLRARARSIKGVGLDVCMPSRGSDLPSVPKDQLAEHDCNKSENQQIKQVRSL